MLRDLTPSRGSRVLYALLLFCALLFAPACGATSGDEPAARPASQETTAAQRDGTARETVGATTEEAAAREAGPAQKEGAVLVHRAGPENVSANSTYLDHPASNGNPDALVFATPAPPAEGGAAENPRPIGVWYDAEREKWAIYNQDRAPMPEGAAFNVTVHDGPRTPADGAGVFVQRAEGENRSANSTYLDHPLSNGNPDAFVSVTPNWNPGGGAGTYNDHNVGVWYDAGRELWAVYNQDRAEMPEDAAFNVAVAEKPADLPGAGASVHRATPENTEGDGTFLDLPDGPDLGALLVTPNWNPGGAGGTYNDHPVGVRFDPGGERWEVYNLDGAPMPEDASFNVVGYSGPDGAASAASETPAGATRDPIEGSGDLEEPPEYRDFYSEGDPETLKKLNEAESFGNAASSAGAIPAVEPFNFGRDPGGPEDKTLYLTVPKIGLEKLPVYNSTSEEDLRKSAVHVPATGFPWQDGANTFIAGHRVGYPNTGSYYVFFDLVDLAEGDEILLEDAAGGRYVYRVTRQVVVGPENVETMNPVEGKSVVSLQTCTLPDYEERIVVQGELVEESA